MWLFIAINPLIPTVLTIMLTAWFLLFMLSMFGRLGPRAGIAPASVFPAGLVVSLLNIR
jgi:hypothetical protein